MNNFSKCLALGLISLVSLPAQEPNVLRKGDLIAVCGDSITEQRLYSRFLEEYFLLCQPAPDLQTMQFGWGGETAAGFLKRMQNDTLTFKPTVATTCYGMNDGGSKAVTETTVNSYRANMEAIVKTFKEGGVRWVVIGGPGALDPITYKRPTVTYEVYNHTLEVLSQTAKEVALKNGCAFADVHGAMKQVIDASKEKLGTSLVIGGADGVHAGPNGHLVMAYAFLKAFGVSGEIGTFTVDLKSGEATAQGGHHILSTSNGVVEIESTQYPFCFLGEPAAEGSLAEVLKFLPFNEELNRLLLKVKNASAEKYKVTWGEDSKTFSASELERGINLAAEFLNNPFCKPFSIAEAAIREQQDFEAVAIKGTLHALPAWRESLPEDKTLLDSMNEGIQTLSQSFRKKSEATVTPVKHQIKIEAL